MKPQQRIRHFQPPLQLLAMYEPVTGSCLMLSPLIHMIRRWICSREPTDDFVTKLFVFPFCAQIIILDAGIRKVVA